MILRHLHILVSITLLSAPGMAQGVLGSVQLPNQPAGQMRYDPFTDRVFVAGAMAQLSTHVVDVSNPAAPFIVGTLPLAGCAIQQATQGASFFGSTGFGGQVVRGDTTTLALGPSATIGFCGGQLAFDGIGRLYVTSQCGGGNDPLHVLDGTLAGLIAGPLGMGGVAGNVFTNSQPAISSIRIYCNRSGGTAVFAASGPIPPLYIQLQPLADTVTGVDEHNNHIYASTSGGGLQVLDGTTHALIADLPGLAGQVAVDGSANRVYVATYAGGLEILDGSNWTSLGSIPTPSGQTSALVSYDPASGRVFYATTGPGGSTVHVVDPVGTPSSICQLDLGSGGPGQAQFTVCGDPLSAGMAATATLSGAPANAFALLAVSSNTAYTPFAGGTVVPDYDTGLLVPFTTDPTGMIMFGVPGGGGPITLYAQWGILDPSQTQGVAISNALQVLFLP